MRTLVFILLSGALSFGCITTKERRLERVQVGMLKDEVLETAGSPTTFARYQGKDRWIYRIVKGSDIVTTEVQFLNGKAVYVGPPPTPALSADEQDKYNQMYNDRQNETENRLYEKRQKEKPVQAQSSEEEL